MLKLTSILILLLFAASLPAATIHADFPGGSIGGIRRISESHYRLGARGESDQDGRNRQANWYYFRVDGATRGGMTFDIVDLPGEYNYQPNRGAITKDTPPVISYDGKTWKHVETYEYDAAEPKLRLRIAPARSRFWIAHCPPYTVETLARLFAEIRGHPDFQENIIGKSAGGRDLRLWSIAHGSPPPKKTVWLMFRQHSWETGSSWTAEGAVRELLTVAGRPLRERIAWKILPMCDPDGVERGGVRFNAHGFDLNRNWDVADRAKMPEIAAQRAAVEQWIRAGNTIDLFFSLHNTETSEYLEGPPDAGGAGKFRDLSARLFGILSARTTFAPTRPLSYSETTTSAGKKGRMNVIQGLYSDFGIPGFLMEQRVSYNPKLGHLPEIEDRVRFGRELVNAIAEALLPGAQ